MKSGEQKRGSREISYEERKTLEEGIRNCLSTPQIAMLLNRPAQSIKNELHRNGGRVQYNADKAQKRAEDMKLRRTIATVHAFSPNPKQDSDEANQLETRVTSLEMQLEIIIETLQQLRKN